MMEYEQKKKLMRDLLLVNHPAGHGVTSKQPLFYISFFWNNRGEMDGNTKYVIPWLQRQYFKTFLYGSLSTEGQREWCEGCEHPTTSFPSVKIPRRYTILHAKHIKIINNIPPY